jgi:GcrA cell cycle regulator
MEWNDERISQLKTLWLSGTSAREIAERLGGVSRNAVIGKVHRLGLGGRAAPAAPRGFDGSAPRRLRAVSGVSQGKTVVARPKAPGQEASQAPARISTPGPRLTCVGASELAPTAELLSLDRHSCRWPVGHPDDEAFGFCGRDRDARTPYCAHHAQQARRPSSLSTSYIEKLAAIR